MTDEWRLVVHNADTAQDPLEVIYQLCRADKDGRILELDATISGGNPGMFKRLREAMDRPMLKLVRGEPPADRALPFKAERMP